MRNLIFLFTGIILIGAGLIVFFASPIKIVSNINIDNAEQIVRYGAGLGTAGLGAIFFIVGIIGLLRGKSQTKQNMIILQNGIDADAIVTFVDKNYSLLVNHKPIYSIVEYKYTDNYGNEHTRRINNLNSDLVIRNNIQVGKTVKIKYLPEDTSKSVILLSTDN